MPATIRVRPTSRFIEARDRPRRGTFFMRRSCCRGAPFHKLTKPACPSSEALEAVHADGNLSETKTGRIATRYPPAHGVPTKHRDIRSRRRNQSFAETALQFRVARSVVTSRVKQLEDHVGAPLFHRSKRVVRLSDVDQAFLRDCTELVGRANDVIDQMCDAKSGPVGIFCCSPSSRP